MERHKKVFVKYYDVTYFVRVKESLFFQLDMCVKVRKYARFELLTHVFFETVYT